MTTCWRCKDEGIVTIGNTKTICGACMGTGVAPRPCPKCGSDRVKLFAECSIFHTGNEGKCCWRCRNCGNKTEFFHSELDAIRAWNIAAGEQNPPSFEEMEKRMLETAEQKLPPDEFRTVRVLHAHYSRLRRADVPS